MLRVHFETNDTNCIQTFQLETTEILFLESEIF